MTQNVQIDPKMQILKIFLVVIKHVCIKKSWKISMRLFRFLVIWGSFLEILNIFWISEVFFIIYWLLGNFWFFPKFSFFGSISTFLGAFWRYLGGILGHFGAFWGIMLSTNVFCMAIYKGKMQYRRSIGILKR